ncbi:MAG TPA: GtrA family protein [Chloroflexota bacterium]|nr:GtrA family protein [Chloroflexota bacterium]
MSRTIQDSGPRNLWEWIRSKVSMSRLFRFGVVGVSGVVVNLVFIRLFFGQFHWTPSLAAALASEFAVVNNFFWNNWWTFGQQTFSPRRFVRFNVASLGGLAITTAVFTILVESLGMYYLIANLIAIGAATSWNFLASVFWTWA